MSNKQEIQNIYTRKANLYHIIFFNILKWDKATESFFSKENYLHSNFRVLDAGCGSGIITKILFKIARMEKINEVIFNAFDLTPAMLNLFRKWIKENMIKNIQLMPADINNPEDLPSSWKSYDLIISSAMLEYLSEKEMEMALKSLRNLLKKDGILIILITKRNFVTKWLVEKLWKAKTYKDKEILNIVSKIGFNNIKLKYFPSSYNYFNRSIIILEARK